MSRPSVTLIKMGRSFSVKEPFRIGYVHVYITILYSHNNLKNRSWLADREYGWLYIDYQLDAL